MAEVERGRIRREACFSFPDYLDLVRKCYGIDQEGGGA